jgi:hypothetical protein
MIRRVVAATLDVITVALAVLAARIVSLGGFVVELSDFRLSFRTPSRTLLWMIVAIVVRLIIDRSTCTIGGVIRTRTTFQRVPDVPDPNQVSAS